MRVMMLLFVVSASAFGQARAKPPDAKALTTAAATAYAAGQFAQAASLLEAARALQENGRIVYNLARAYERAGDLDKAIGAYHAYLQRDDAERLVLPKARAALQRLTAQKAAAPVEPTAPVAEPQAVEPAEREPPAAPEEVVAAPLAVPSERGSIPVEPAPDVRSTPPETPPPSHRGAVARGLGVAGMVVGVASVGVGIALGVWASSAAASAQMTVDPQLKPQLRAAAVGRATAADVVWISGAVLAAVGLVLCIVSWLA